MENTIIYFSLVVNVIGLFGAGVCAERESHLWTFLLFMVGFVGVAGLVIGGSVAH